MKYFRYTIICLVLLGFSCKHKENNPEGPPVLKAELQQQPVSIFDIFEKVEVIPLETTEESLFPYIDNVECLDDTLFVFSTGVDAVFMFDTKGRYLNKIQRIGRGPGEYLHAYDFMVNGKERTIKILEAFGAILTYGFDGNFIKKDVLPANPNNYHDFEILDDGSYAIYSRVDWDDENGVNIIDVGANEIKRGFFPKSAIWGTNRGHAVFYRYGGEVYYYESMRNKIYTVTHEGYDVAYEWDFGVQLINPDELLVKERKPANASNEFRKNLKEGKYPYTILQQQQNKNYYYATIGYMPNYPEFTVNQLFYDKRSGESLYFQKTVEGINPLIIRVTDDYAIGLLNYNKTEPLQKIVSPEDAELLRNRKDDDNAWLVKYTFK